MKNVSYIKLAFQFKKTTVFDFLAGLQYDRGLEKSYTNLYSPSVKLPQDCIAPKIIKIGQFFTKLLTNKIGGGGVVGQE